ncbi:MAG TPA: hypothetical protein VLS45_08970 [Methylomicrobium sp.]|nr:hypothetical protein [Methylomicrobium sp.]
MDKRWATGTLSSVYPHGFSSGRSAGRVHTSTGWHRDTVVLVTRFKPLLPRRHQFVSRFNAIAGIVFAPRYFYLLGVG